MPNPSKLINIAAEGLIVLGALAAVYDLMRGRIDRARESFGNLLTFAGVRVLGLVFREAGVLSVLYAMQRHAWVRLPAGALTSVACFLLADLIYFSRHWLYHHWRVMWLIHSAHHSSHDFTLTTAIRVNWLGGFIEDFFYILPVLAGFPLGEVYFWRVFVRVHQTWVHTQKIGSLGFLDRIFHTPSIHRVHHASNAPYRYRNYGGVLNIWDRMAGTFQPELADVKPLFGPAEPTRSMNPFKIVFEGWGLFFRDLGRARTPRALLATLFSRPEIRPRITS